jgi:hypothetical protein
MRKHADIAQAKFFPQAGVLAHLDRVVAAAERWLRPVDHLDYSVRRRLLPVRLEQASRSTPLRKLSVPHTGLSSDIQHAIGQRLCAEYAVEGFLPSRLAKLLREFEQRRSRAEGFLPDGYANTA